MTPVSDPSAGSRRAWLIVLGCSFAIGVAAWLIVRAEKGNAGGLGELLLASVFGEDTDFASGYTERGFIAIQLGSDAATVLRELGEPLERRANRRGTTYWVYTQSPRSRNYRVRQIVFQHGAVTGKLASYYWD